MRRQLFWGGLVLACSLGAAAATLAYNAERRVERRAAVGETVRLRGHINYQRGCAVIPTIITVVQPPRHGTLAIRDESATLADPIFGDQCRGQSGTGKVVYYTRTSLGTDTFDHESSSDNGVVRVFVTID